MGENLRDRCRIQSFSVTPEKKHIIDWLDEMAQRERKSKSEIIIRCIEYYYNKKWPGNPQPPLFPKPPDPELNPEALREARIRKAITFLRFKARLSYQQISLIVGRSYGYVYKLCKEMREFYPEFDNRKAERRMSRNFRRLLPKYKERFQLFLEGKIKSVEEAFRW